MEEAPSNKRTLARSSRLASPASASPANACEWREMNGGGGDVGRANVDVELDGRREEEDNWDQDRTGLGLGWNWDWDWD